MTVRVQTAGSFRVVDEDHQPVGRDIHLAMLWDGRSFVCLSGLFDLPLLTLPRLRVSSPFLPNSPSQATMRLIPSLSRQAHTKPTYLPPSSPTRILPRSFSPTTTCLNTCSMH